MVLENAHTVHINHSTLNEIHGDYYYHVPAAGERGVFYTKLVHETSQPTFHFL